MVRKAIKTDPLAGQFVVKWYEKRGDDDRLIHSVHETLENANWEAQSATRYRQNTWGAASIWQILPDSTHIRVRGYGPGEQ